MAESGPSVGVSAEVVRDVGGFVVREGFDSFGAGVWGEGLVLGGKGDGEAGWLWWGGLGR